MHNKVPGASNYVNCVGWLRYNRNCSYWGHPRLNNISGPLWQSLEGKGARISTFVGRLEKSLRKRLHAIAYFNPVTRCIIDTCGQRLSNETCRYYPMLKHAFWCFPQCVADFAQCRPIISVDDTFFWLESTKVHWWLLLAWLQKISSCRLHLQWSRVRTTRTGHCFLALWESKYLVQIDMFAWFWTVTVVCLTVLKNILRGTLHLCICSVHIILPQTFVRNNGARRLSSVWQNHLRNEGFVSQDHVGGFSTERECANTHI
jgi:hypothetical protein